MANAPMMAPVGLFQALYVFRIAIQHGCSQKPAGVCKFTYGSVRTCLMGTYNDDTIQFMGIEMPTPSL